MEQLIPVLVAGALGIAGTAVGSLVAARAALRNQDRHASAARDIAEKQEFRSAMIEFCTALMIYRGAELDRADARRGGRQDLPALTAHAYRTRTAARNALYRLELSVASTRISLEARKAFDLAKSVKDTTTKEQTQERRDGTDTAIANLVQIARDIMEIRLH